MTRTIFSTPLLTPCLRLLAALGLKISGWKIQSAAIPQPPFVLIGAPHTSNWDFLLMLAVILQLRLQISWMGKNSLFRFPFGPLMKWMGGIPIDRSKANNVVMQTVSQFKRRPNLIVLIPPEGTRSKVERWKTGFYHIAHKAGVPVVMAGIDGPDKNIRLLGEFHPSGDVEKDLPLVQAHYQGLMGIRPEKT